MKPPRQAPRRIRTGETGSRRIRESKGGYTGSGVSAAALHLSIPFVAARRSAMSQTYRHCSVAFVVILAVALSSCSALNWNAQGPVKVEDVYSTENIPGTQTLPLNFSLFLTSHAAFAIRPVTARETISRLSQIMSFKICVENLFTSMQALSSLAPSQMSSSAATSPSSERCGFCASFLRIRHLYKCAITHS